MMKNEVFGDSGGVWGARRLQERKKLSAREIPGYPPATFFKIYADFRAILGASWGQDGSTYLYFCIKFRKKLEK